MRRRMSRYITLAAAMASALSIGVAMASPATAAAPVNNCAFSMFPTNPAGSSFMQLACTLDSTTLATAAFTKMEDYGQAVWHPGAGRSTAADGVTSGSSAAISSATAHFSAADVNHGISGKGIATGAFIVSVTDATHATMDVNGANAQTKSVFLIENSDGRAVSDGVTTTGSNTVTSATANFRSADVGRTITGTNLAHGTKISSVTNATTVHVSINATDTGTAQSLTISSPANLTDLRQVDDAVTTSGSATVTSAMAKFNANDVNLPVATLTVAAGIPKGAYITAVNSATSITMSANATKTTTHLTVTIGGPNAMAPTDGSTIASLGAELNLNPSLVSGSDPCTAGTAEGFNLQGLWHNPGAIDTTPLGGPTDTSLTAPVIGQLVYPTSVVSFAGYVTQVPAATAGESDTAAHYDVTYPFLPTGLAVCGAPDTTGGATTWGFSGVALNQQASSLGTPSTNFVRALQPFAAGVATKTSTAYVHILTNSGGTQLYTKSTACKETYPGTVGFPCGKA